MLDRDDDTRSRPDQPSRPARGDELELTVDSLAFGGAGVARLDGYVVFVVRRGARRPRARGRRQVQARLRRGARGRDPRAEPRADPAGRRPPGRAVAGAALRAPARGQAGAGRTTRCARIGKLDGFELEPIVPALEQWRYRNKLEYSFGAETSGRLVCGFHAPGPLGRDRRGARLPAGVRGRQRRSRADRGVVPRAGTDAPYDRRSGEGCCATWSCAKGRRTGQLQARLVTSPGELDRDALAAAAQPLATGCCGRRSTASPRRRTGGSTELLAGDDRIGRRSAD